MDIFKNLGMTVIIVVGVYLAIFLSYILIPASVFLFVFYIIKEINKNDTEIWLSVLLLFMVGMDLQYPSLLLMLENILHYLLQFYLLYQFQRY